MHSQFKLLLDTIQYRIHIHQCRYRSLQDLNGFHLNKQHELELIIKLISLAKFCQLSTTNNELKSIKEMLYNIYV